MQSTNYIIEKDSINFSGMEETGSASYGVSDTAGEVGTGEIQQSCYSVNFNAVDSDSINAGNGSSLNFTGAFTISAWIKPSVADGNIVRKVGVNTGYMMFIHTDRSLSLNSNEYASDLFSDPGAVTLGSWNYVVGTVDGSGLANIYVNGTSVKSGNRQALNTTAGSDLVIGGNSWNSGNFFNGFMDDVRIYNRAITSTEVSDLYNGKEISSNNLIGHWNLNEGSGTSANDSSGNANTGTMANAVYSSDTPAATCKIGSIGYRQSDPSGTGTTYITVSAPADVTLSPAIGGLSGGVGDGNAVWKVTTNSSSGYQLDIKASSSPALAVSPYSFADYVPSTANPDYNWSVSSSASEFGYTVEGTHTASKFLDNGSACATGSGNVADRCWLGFSTTDQTIATSAAANEPSGTDTTVKFRAEAGNQRMQEDGNYTATVVVTAVSL